MLCWRKESIHSPPIQKRYAHAKHVFLHNEVIDLLTTPRQTVKLTVLIKLYYNLFYT